MNDVESTAPAAGVGEDDAAAGGCEGGGDFGIRGGVDLVDDVLDGGGGGDGDLKGCAVAGVDLEIGGCAAGGVNALTVI